VGSSSMGCVRFMALACAFAGCDASHPPATGDGVFMDPCVDDSDCVCPLSCAATVAGEVPDCENPTGRLCLLTPPGADSAAALRARGCDPTVGYMITSCVNPDVDCGVVPRCVDAGH